MRKYDGRLAGILGAIIIHLIAAIIFMVVQIGSLNIREVSKEYEIVLQDKEDNLQNVDKSHIPGYSVEQVLSGDEEMLNIARNLARQPDVKINREDYIDMVKNELIDQGKLGKDNYIDEQKRSLQNRDGTVTLEDKNEKTDTDKPSLSQEMAARYSGPTRIYYDLPGRTHTYLPIPIYKCEGSGKVVLSIEVNPKGLVVKAEVLSQESDTSDQCLIDNAVKTALISRFNPDAAALKNQAGTLTYHFVAQ